MQTCHELKVQSSFISVTWLNLFFYTILFVIFLFPYSIGDGVSGNYLFFLFPILTCIFTRKILLPNQNIQIIIFFYILIFVVALSYQYEYYQYVDRRVISFLLFTSIFYFMFIKINKEMIAAFKLSIVVVSIYFSSATIISYFLLGGTELGFEAKGALGSQRYGFIYILAIWLVLFYESRSIIFKILKYIALIILLSGLLLTFSRSGIVAIICSYLFYIFFKFKKDLSIKKLMNVKYITSLVFIIFLAFTIYHFLTIMFPVAIDFFAERLFSLETSSGITVFKLNDPEASEGYRVFMLKIIVDFVLTNPFTGSGYLGTWIIFDDLSGSAHNQYLDVLFRTGVFGFLIYFWLLFRLMKFLKYSDEGLFWGMIGVIVYGLFHETFKLSHGAFVLSFLTGMMHFSLRNGNSILNKPTSKGIVVS